jgi:hypothetical protein
MKVMDFGGKPVVPLGTANSNMGSFLKDFQGRLRNGEYVQKEGFLDVGHWTAEQEKTKLSRWLDEL